MVRDPAGARRGRAEHQSQLPLVSIPASRFRTMGALVSVGRGRGSTGIRWTSSSVTPTRTASRVLQSRGSIVGFARLGYESGRPPPGSLLVTPPSPPNQHACVILNGEVYCWGKSERGASEAACPMRSCSADVCTTRNPRVCPADCGRRQDNLRASSPTAPSPVQVQNERGQLGIGSNWAVHPTRLLP